MGGTFGSARRGLGGTTAHPVPSLLYQMLQPTHQHPVYQSPYCYIMVCCSAFLMCPCYGLHKIIDICDNVEHKWDIKFNPLKSQLMAFSMSNPDRCNIMLNGNQIPWASKVRYLGLYFLCNGYSQSTDYQRCIERRGRLVVLYCG